MERFLRKIHCPKLCGFAALREILWGFGFTSWPVRRYNPRMMIVCDWGSSRLRAWLVGAEGKVSDHYESEMGVKAMAGSDTNMAEWLGIGIKGVGLGSSLYRAGDTPAEAATKAKRMIDAFNSGRAAY